MKKPENEKEKLENAIELACMVQYINDILKSINRMGKKVEKIFKYYTIVEK